MADVAVGVTVVPLEGHFVVETDVSKRVQTPLVATPVGGDVPARKQGTQLVEIALVTFDLVVGFGRTESLATRTSSLRNIRRQTVGVAREIRGSAAVALDLAELVVEIVVLFLGVGSRVEPRRVSVGLFDGHPGLLSRVDVRRFPVAISRFAPALVGLA